MIAPKTKIFGRGIPAFAIAAAVTSIDPILLIPARTNISAIRIRPAIATKFVKGSICLPFAIAISMPFLPEISQIGGLEVVSPLGPVTRAP